jgi:hypothetical protein
MKFNWGTGIIIAFVCFISFIMYFIISMNLDKKYDHDLVNEDYYQQELEFQNDINKQENAKTLSNAVTLNIISEGIELEFPKELSTQKISGKIVFYRPSNKDFDFELPLKVLENHKIIVPKDRLLEGRWNVKIDWQYEDQNYMLKKAITY